jgi:hypothetical protein
MLTCKACQKEFQGYAQYCPNCGSKLEICDHIETAKQDIIMESQEKDDNRLSNQQAYQNNICAVCEAEGTVDGSMVINSFTGEETITRNLNFFIALLYYLIGIAVSFVAGYLFFNGTIIPSIAIFFFVALPLINAAYRKMDNFKYAITIPRYFCSYCKYSWYSWGGESQIQKKAKANDYFANLSESKKQHIEKLRKEAKEKRQKDIEVKKDCIRLYPNLLRYKKDMNNNQDRCEPQDMDDNQGGDKPQTVEAVYLIDYVNGTISLGDLPIGARVVDSSWEWEFRTGNDCSGGGDVKPATWIIVAKDHYDKLESHVTLLAEELIGQHAFDNSTDRDHEYSEIGYNHWGESGTANATHGLRPWLNSNGIHAGEGFYRAFLDSFKEAVLETTLPNKEWPKGTAYSTRDKVFIPSSTELGDNNHECTYPIGSAYPFFTGASDAKRVALLGDEACWYWTRSPGPGYGDSVRCVSSTGAFSYYSVLSAYSSGIRGLRPALNLKSGILVSEIKD